MEQKKNELAERRAGQIYCLITRNDLEKSISDAAIAGGKAAVDNILVLFSRGTAKNLGVLATLLVAILAAWVTGAIEHIKWVP